MKNEIHERALEVARRFKQVEADLLKVLQAVDEARVYLDLGCSSLFHYAVAKLELSESVAANFIAVARSSRAHPVLMSAIESGKLSVSKARKVTPVLTTENQEEWVEKATRLSSRDLEREVARAQPRDTGPERMKYVSGERLELVLGISEELSQKLRQIQDLESQRRGWSVSLEDALEVMVEAYLEARDPVRKAERAQRRKECQEGDEPVTGHVTAEKGPIPASERHRANLRDERRCTYRDLGGRRCENRRWLHLHHRIPRAKGGTNRAENLATLCAAHHRGEHQAPPG